MPLLTTARDPLGVQTGDVVTVRSSSRRILGLAGLVYLCPVLLFFLGGAMGPVLGLSVTASGIAGFALGFVPAVLTGRRLRRRGAVEVTIIGVER